MKKSQQTPYKSWKEQPIKEFFAETINDRRVIDKHTDHTAEYCDEYSIAFILLRNLDETVEFLANATIEEMACAIDALDLVVTELPKNKAQIILDIFKKKLNEFPDLINYSLEYSLYVYEEMLEDSQYIIDCKDD